MGDGLESRCVGRTVHGTIHTLNTTYATSNAPDDGRMYPKRVELRIRQ